MSELPGPGASIDLTNCAREPIHVPGSIQPHGALLAFLPDGRLAARSANAQELLGDVPGYLEPLGAAHTPAAIREALDPALATPGERGSSPVAIASGREFDLTWHHSESLLIAEWEPRPAAPRKLEKFSFSAQRALERIQRCDSLQRLLEVTTEEIANLTEFDRVMAYRFQHDDSGEVVAERRHAGIEPFLGLRYPASDIPSQARFLYTLNPLRFIVDVRYRPVAIEPNVNPTTGGPIDLTHSILRSVSPIHVEYLTNMGVRASMSVSIVVKGKLWGLFACHHYAPHFVPHEVRMTCQLLSQVVSVLVERMLETDRAVAVSRSVRALAALVDRAKGDDDIVRALARGEPTVAQLVPCAGATVTSLSQVATMDDAPSRAQVAEVVAWLNANGAPAMFHSSNIAEDAPALARACEGYVGVAAARFSPEPNSYLMWFRKEEVSTVRWAGRPDKQETLGPNGPRLSPRGSFAEWREEVRGRSLPWLVTELETIRELRRALSDISAERLQDALRARDVMIAMLGHDLRGPLQAISMSAEALRRDQSLAGKVQRQISSSSGRMSRLISHVLDVSRIQSGAGLGITRRRQDVGRLLSELIAEAAAAYPGTEIVTQVESPGEADVDADRIAQVFSNLLANARHHGAPGGVVRVKARRLKENIEFRVINHGDLPKNFRTDFSAPFRPGSLHRSRNPQGLGLGLYIVGSIVREHGGTIGASADDGLVTFTVTLPIASR